MDDEGKGTFYAISLVTVRNRFHSLCPYFAMFPETFAEEWIAKLMNPGDTVFDPFCGRGTVPFQALLMDRDAVACDINPVAYCLSAAKSAAPKLPTLLARLRQLERDYSPSSVANERALLPEFFSVAYAQERVRRVLSRVIRSRISAGQRPAHGGKSRDLTDGGPKL
ncbi:DNA methyltransferase [Candidatus Poriferisodalis sp.]|uniref:DNA methyltransferase n=1 Tax=Candidatus Poriferisodalis sp. TaxID=3101277 RepID=UPI003B01F502